MMNTTLQNVAEQSPTFWSWFFHPYSLLGGFIIGGSAALLYFLNGRIAGISGISGRLVAQLIPFPSHLKQSFHQGETVWRLLFVAGLLSGGFFLTSVLPEHAPKTPDAPTGVLVVAGLLVGIGTRMGLGCTSGHGVCGIGRFSVTSIVSTLSFMIMGFVTVAAVRRFFP